VGLFPSHFSQIFQGLVNLVYLFQEPAFCSVDSLYAFLFVSIFFVWHLFLLFLSCLYWVLLALVFPGV
jgi:hypothetical protein